MTPENRFDLFADLLLPFTSLNHVVTDADRDKASLVMDYMLQDDDAINQLCFDLKGLDDNKTTNN